MSEKKYRIYEIAKDYGVTSKDVMAVLETKQIEFKNHTSSVNEDARQMLEQAFRPGKPAAPKVAPAKPAVSVTPPSTATIPAPAPEVKATPSEVAKAPVAPVSQPAARPPQQQQARPPFQPRPQQGQAPAQPQGARPGFTPSGQGGQSRPGGQPFRPSGQSQPGGQPFRPSGQPQGARPGGQPFRPSGQSQPGGQPFRPSGQPQGARPGGQPFRPSGQPQGARPGGFTPSGQGGQSRPGGQPFRPSGQSQGPGNRPASGGAPASRFGAPPSSPSTGESANRFNPKKKVKEKDGRWKDEEAALKRGNDRKNKHQFQKPVMVKAQKVKAERIEVGDFISVKDFAEKAGLETNEVIKKLLLLGIMATINQEIDFDTAALIGADLDIVVEELPPEADPTEIIEAEDDPSTLVTRPPVVTIMGHVDHGKTSLLDVIRATNVTAREAGGITQHIGAYQISIKGKKITFLDTPGHEAFTAMRARGAKATDIAILVVAANDGVMPQTIEAMNHAKSAGVPIIVAINKMDIPDANPDRVKQQLSDHGLLSEDWGGDVIMVPVSARQKMGIDDLLENILLVAEVEDLKANPNRTAQGIVIEAQLDKGRGPVATILVQKGTLRVGDSIVAGVASGKVRALINDKGETVKKADPSVPVEVLGLSDVPEAGDLVFVADEKVIRSVVAKRQVKKRAEDTHHNQKVSLEDIFQQIQDGQIKDLNIVIKGDVQGSIEALRQSLESLKNKEVRVNIIHSGVGAISESDVMLASASNAIIIGFNVRPDGNARKAGESEKVDIRTYRVIYEAIQDVEQALEGMLSPEFKEVVYGHAEVRQVIGIPKGGVVAGSYVQDGKITNSSKIRVTRSGIVIHEGGIESLRRFKDEVKEVATGYECGITLERFRDIKEGDILEAFGMEEIKRGQN